MSDAAYDLINTDGSTTPYGYEVLMKGRDVAAIFKVDPRTVNLWAKQGKLRSVRTQGGHRRYPEDAVRALYEGRFEDARSRSEIPVHVMHYIPPEDEGNKVIKRAQEEKRRQREAQQRATR